MCEPAPAGVAGAVSRSLTAPIDRLKMLLQVQDTGAPLTIRQGIRQMAAEGALSRSRTTSMGCNAPLVEQYGSPDHACAAAGTIRAFFKGNGANVVTPQRPCAPTLPALQHRIRLYTALAGCSDQCSRMLVPATGSSAEPAGTVSLNVAKRRAQVKIAPETALKLSFNDAIKHVIASDPEYITAMERMVGGAIAGASAQVPLLVLPRFSISCAVASDPWICMTSGMTVEL